MNLRPTNYTAAVAGILAALAWPYVWARFGGADAEGGTELVVSTLLLIALPAHALVVGMGRADDTPPGQVDVNLLKRIGAWLGAAACTVLVRGALGL